MRGLARIGCTLAGLALPAPSGPPTSGGAGPAGIGLSPPPLAAAASTARPGHDNSVMPTSVASDPVSPAGHNRPHIVRHLLHLDTIGRGHAQEVELHRGEKHA